MRRPTEIMREPQAAAAGASRGAGVTTGLKLGPTAVVALIAAVFLTLSEAFGTGAMPFATRLLYWMLSVGGGTVIGTLSTEAMERRRWLQGGMVRTVLLVSLALTLPLTFLAWGLARLLTPNHSSPSLLGFAVPVLAVTVVLSTVNVLLGVLRHREEALATAPEPATASAGAPQVRFLERLPRKLKGGRLCAVQAEDHYLRIHTDIGSDLILMRLSDAIAELEGLEGAQTHRSWWVAKDAVDEVERGDGRAVLKLKGGVEAPVSRTYARALREAGWF